MQKYLINNVILNEMIGRVLGSDHNIAKKMTLGAMIIFSLLFYGFESALNSLVGRNS